MDLDCDICMESFDTEDRRPRVLPCGHTYCLGCLRRMSSAGAAITCPEDRKVFPNQLKDFVDNFYVMSRLAEISQNRHKQKPRLWCYDCCTTLSSADDTCSGAGHRVVRLQAARAELAARQVHALERLAAGLRSLEEQCAEQRQRVHDTVARLHLCSSTDTAADTDWEQAQISAHLLHQLQQEMDQMGSDAVRLELQLDQRCFLSERVSLQEQPALSIALMMLHQQGQLLSRPGKAEAKDPGSLEKLDFRDVFSGGQLSRDEKMGILIQTNVAVLTGVECNADPLWTLAVLVKHSARLEELHLRNVHREHLLALHAMPRLRKLRVIDWHMDVENSPVQFMPSAAAEQGDGDGNGLQRLEADLPASTVQSLVTAHRHSLQILRLWVATDSALPSLPEFRRLRVLTLMRPAGRHTAETCVTQLAALRRALPHCNLRCVACRG